MVMAALLGTLPLVAQNIIVNGGFEQGNTGFDTEHNYVGSGTVGEGCYCVDNTASGHAGGVAWYPVVGYGGSGMYMLVNGFGNTATYPKAVWKQTVNVTAQTDYTFSCQLANLSQGLLFLDPLPAVIQLKINGANVGESLSLNPTNYNWQLMTRTWNSGNYFGPVEIEICDLYQSNPGLGDDFGLDEISFVPSVVYDATANGDQAGPVCLSASVDIDVLANDDIQPNATDVIVSVTNNPLHGTAAVLTDKKIRFTYTDGSFAGFTDQFQYRVNNHGVTSEAMVTVSLCRVPTVGNVTAPSGICAGESFDLTLPSIEDNGSGLMGQGWEIAPSPTGLFVPLTNNDIPFDYNGHYLRYVAINSCGTGCSDVVQVTVFPTDPTYEAITACDTYVWNDIVCDHTCDTTAQVNTEYGCEITAHLHFTLNEDYFIESQTETSCNEFVWRNETHYVSGVYNDTVYNPNPIECDSVYILYLTINHEPEIMGDIVPPPGICAGDVIQVVEPQYELNHSEGGLPQWEYATAPEGPFSLLDPSGNGLPYGDYYLRFTVHNGCGADSSNVVLFRVNDAPEVHGTLSALEVCEGFPMDLPDPEVVWKNVDESDRLTQWQLSPDGDNYAAFDPAMPMQAMHDGYWVRFMARNSCGEGYLGPVVVSVLVVDDIWDTIPACNNYVLPWGETITQSQMIDTEIVEPCPHLLHQYVMIHHSDTVPEPVISCQDVFEWHGQTFERSDEMQIAYWETSNIYGCDSVVELRLSFGDYAAITETVTACEEYTWPRTGAQYFESQLDSLFIQGSGTVCDSMIYLNLTIGHDVSTEGDPWTECAGFEWNGITYYEDGIVYETLQTAVTHCDSVVSHPLTILQPRDSAFYRTSCKQIVWHGQYCGEEGDYTHVFESQQGCDSLVLTMHFSFAEEIKVDKDTTICMPFDWYGNWCDTDGATYSHTFMTPEECDSTVFLHLTVGKPYSGQQFRTVCDSVTLFGVFYGPGNYLIPLDPMVGQNGCDSIVTINLFVRSMDDVGEIQGESNVFVATNLISGIYSYTLDVDGIIGNVQWNLSHPDWAIVDQDSMTCRILVTTSGHATLKATFRLDCGEVERTFDIQSGFFDLDDRLSVAARVFPNPTQGSLTVEAEDIRRVRVIDMLGQTCLEEQFGGSENATIQLHSLPSSVYLLEIQTEKGRTMRRFVLCK